MLIHVGDITLYGDPPYPEDSDGVTWYWTDDEPWSPSPSPRAVSGENATDHGSWDATEFFESRTYALTGYALTEDPAAMTRAKNRLFAACGLDVLVRTEEPGLERQAHFRRSGDVLWGRAGIGACTFSVPLWAGDPRIYSTDTYNASVAFPTSTGGMSWPAVWPATWDAVTVTGEMSLSNDGTETAWPIYRIDGPVAEPVIVNADTGQSMHFSITLGPGEWLTVDTGSHEVLGNGDPNASRRNVFHGDWFGLAPGSTTVRFNGASGVGSTLSASWRSTWI